MNRLQQALIQERGPAVLALVIRVAAGGFFVAVSLGKFFEHASETHDFDRYGVPFPATAVIVVGIVELLGGVALIAGLETRISAAALAADMVGAIATAGRVEGGTFNLGIAPALLILMLIVLWTGPGMWSLDRVLAHNGVTRAVADSP